MGKEDSICVDVGWVGRREGEKNGGTLSVASAVTQVAAAGALLL